MTSIGKPKTPAYPTTLFIAASLAFIALFMTPLLSGSNHKCPVLRERDSGKGPSAQAVPAFARKYNCDCTYCHTAWPQLNRVGLQFRYLGYRMPYEVPVHEGATKGATTAAPTAPLGPAAKIAEGHKLFQSMQCFTCHVDGGNVIDPTKPIRGADFLKKYPDDSQIADIIRHGKPGTAMPAYDKDRLSDDQISLVIAYVRSLTTTTQSK